MTFLQELLSFSCWIMSYSLQHHGLQHARVPCPSLSISSLLTFMSIESVMLSHHLILSVFSFSLQSFLASGSFPVSRLFASGGQNIGASASVLPMNIQGWFPSELDWSTAVEGTLKRLLQHNNLKASILQCSVFFFFLFNFII